LIRVIVIIVVYVLAVHWAPGDILPLSVGGVLGSWRGTGIAPAPATPQ